MEEDILCKYRRAKQIMQCEIPQRVVLNDIVFPHWIKNSDCFWYSRDTNTGKEYRLVDATAKSNTLAFDHKTLADALERVLGKKIDPLNLPIEGDKDITITTSPLQVHFQALGANWLFDAEKSNLSKIDSPNIDEYPSDGFGFNFAHKPLISPDGRKAAFVRENNLWVRDQDTREERAVTKDGTRHYRYGRDILDIDPLLQALWSPDSKRIFIAQTDTRKAKERTAILYGQEDGTSNCPELHNRYSIIGDEHTESSQLSVIEVSSSHKQEVDYHQLPIMTNMEPSPGFFTGGLGWWASDSRRAFFVDISHGAKAVRVVELDSHTGTTRVLFEETSDTTVNLSHSFLELPIFLPLPESDELVWYSERSGWGHLYLYDLVTGKLKHQITDAKSQWLVRNILHFDPVRRELLIQTAARDANISPYYRDICKVSIDSGELTTLLSHNFDTRVYGPWDATLMSVGFFQSKDRFAINGVSPCGQYLVTTFSRVDTAPISKLIDRNGREILTLEEADVSNLPTGWKWPEPVQLKSADGSTDISGVIFRPSNFCSDKKYPVIDYSNSSRMACALPLGSFRNSRYASIDYFLPAALATLGFIVVMIEGRGTTSRSKSFHDHHYGDPAYASDFEDRIAGLHQLAERYTYMDLDRVGISGIECASNGVYGLLDHPEFYKVAVVHHLVDPLYSSGLYDSKFYNLKDMTSITNTCPTDYNGHSIESFCGKLLLIMGAANNPASTLRLVEVLQRANKDFDMLCLPNLGNCMTNYTTRREWNYLVRHLQGIEPPKNFQLKTGRDVIEEINEQMKETILEQSSQE